MDTRPLVELSLFPDNMTVRQIKSYIDANYPIDERNKANEEIYIVYRPLNLYGGLPPEVLNRILQSDYKKSANIITKDIRTHALTDIYASECNKPISPKEIRTGLIVNGKNALIIQFIEELVDVYRDIKLMPITEKKYATEAYNERIKGKIIMSGTQDTGGEHEKWTNNGFATALDTPMGRRMIDPEDIILDIFSYYRIRERRRSCVNFNPRYAKDALITEFNDMFHPQLDEETPFENAKIAFVANRLAFTIDNNVDPMRQEYNFSDQTDVDEINDIYSEAYEIIRSKVEELTK